MIYFDNGATTLQKPIRVHKAVENALMTAANPGRSGHRPAMRAAQIVYSCREAIAELFHMENPERVVFTMNATHALNIAIKSVLHGGGHAVVSGYEHNSVVRPLEAMRDRGVCYTAAYSRLFSRESALNAIEQAIDENTRCVVLNHVSNVFGFILPLEEVDALCAKKGVPLIVDASQSAGAIDIDMPALESVAFVCMPGHKGLYGPQGTGVLLCAGEENLHSLMEGGTGSNSLVLRQPDFLPDIFESGTLNVPGIAGLLEGVRFVASRRGREILAHESLLVSACAHGLKNIGGVKVFHDETCQAGVLAFTAEGFAPEVVAEGLSQKGICTRPGLHCSPLAHRSAGTLPEGAVRVSFSIFNNINEINTFLQALGPILKKN